MSTPSDATRSGTDPSPLLGRPLLGRPLLGRPLLGRFSIGWSRTPPGRPAPHVKRVSTVSRAPRAIPCFARGSGDEPAPSAGPLPAEQAFYTFAGGLRELRGGERIVGIDRGGDRVADDDAPRAQRQAERAAGQDS